MTALLLVCLHAARNTRIQEPTMSDRFNVPTVTGFTVLIERLALALFGRLRPIPVNGRR